MNAPAFAGQPGGVATKARNLISSIAGLALALALLAAPASALAQGPTVAISPPAGPAGTLFEIAGRGFRPNAQVAIVVFGPDGGRLDGIEVATEADGAAYARFNSTGSPPGSYAVSIELGQAQSARGAFTITPDGGAGDAGESLTFPETGFALSGRFLRYWRANGLDFGDAGISYRESLALFGFPIAAEREETLEDGRRYTVQYFERARFEYHPENGDPRFQVLLGQFGRRIRPADPPVAPLAGAVHFAETGHNLGGRFLEFWQQNGGLLIFGFPIGEPFAQQLENGVIYTVQYFERARLELHPESAGTPYEVQLGQFGRRVLEGR
jgi:hypothetical protein